jgi:hypothetical protein
LCGKDAAISGFDPQNLDRDIYIRQVVKLPPGEGFTFEPDISVLGDDEFTPKIKDRCIDLIRLFKEQGTLTEEELMEELKIGVPVEGTDTVIPFPEFIKILSQQQTQKTQAINDLKKSLYLNKPDEYKEKYEKLVNKLESKRKIDQILRYLYNNLESEAVPTEDDWVLMLFEVKSEPLRILMRRLYGLTMEERENLQKRIYSDSPELAKVFDLMKTQPTIRDVNDLMNLQRKQHFPGHN